MAARPTRKRSAKHPPPVKYRSAKDPGYADGLMAEAQRLIERAKKIKAKDLLESSPEAGRLEAERKRLRKALHKVHVSIVHKENSIKSHQRWAKTKEDEIDALRKEEKGLLDQQSNLEVQWAALRQAALTRAVEPPR